MNYPKILTKLIQVSFNSASIISGPWKVCHKIRYEKQPVDFVSMIR